MLRLPAYFSPGRICVNCGNTGGSELTAKLGFVHAALRAGEFGVHSVDHFALAVPDAAEAKRFYCSFGLDAREEGGGIGLYTAESAHRWGMITEGERKRLQYRSFAAWEADITAIRDRLQALQLRRLDPPKGIESQGRSGAAKVHPRHLANILQWHPRRPGCHCLLQPGAGPSAL